MNPTLASQRLLDLPVPDDARVARTGSAVELSLRRSSLRVTVTVPLGVREWFVEASDCSSGTIVEDWCDYDGYDECSIEQLDRDMAEDLTDFVDRLLARELRIVGRQGAHVALEWKVGDLWQQAIPLTSDAV